MVKVTVTIITMVILRLLQVLLATEIKAVMSPSSVSICVLQVPQAPAGDRLGLGRSRG